MPIHPEHLLILASAFYCVWDLPIGLLPDSDLILRILLIGYTCLLTLDYLTTNTIETIY